LPSPHCSGKKSVWDKAGFFLGILRLGIGLIAACIYLAAPADAQLRPGRTETSLPEQPPPQAKPVQAKPVQKKPVQSKPAQAKKSQAKQVPAKAPVKKPAEPLQLTPQATPQTKLAPNATSAPVMALPQASEPERRGLMHRPDPFTPAQRITLAKINQTYNAAREMSGIFTQVESNGSATSGRFFISKPGRIRFVYDPPSNLDIVADGTQLAIRDKKLGTQDVYQLWQTPLRYLLKENIDLLEDARVVSILQDTNVVTVSIDEDVAMTQGRLTLYFSASDYKLQQWTVTDGRGMETSVAVTKLEVNKPNDQRLFAL
jgi:outer membrane lipoprotein-sorting protein